MSIISKILLSLAAVHGLLSVIEIYIVMNDSKRRACKIALRSIIIMLSLALMAIILNK